MLDVISLCPQPCDLHCYLVGVTISNQNLHKTFPSFSLHRECCIACRSLRTAIPRDRLRVEEQVVAILMPDCRDAAPAPIMKPVLIAPVDAMPAAEGDQQLALG